MTEPTEQPGTSLRPGDKSGDMTKVMRAAARLGPKVLRVGVVKQGHVVEERIIKDRSNVSVGSNEKNLFVIKANEIPSRFALFEARDGRYYLNFNAAMSGRLAQPSGTQDLAELRSSAKETSLGYTTPLTEDVRGKVTIGDTTFLFQFVAPPPQQPKPQLPASVLRGANGVDWRTTIIAAFAFLGHFMAVGLLYSDWLDPIVDTEMSVRTLVEQVKNLPPPPELEEKKPEDEAKDKEDPKEEKKPEEVKQVQKNKPKEPGEKTKLSTAEVASLSAELDSIDLDILATTNGMTATEDVLAFGDTVSLAAMDRAAASGGGVSSGGPGGLKLSSGGGAIAIGEAGNGLQDIGSKGKTVEDTSGKSGNIEGPKGKATVGGTNVTGKVQDANSVMSRMTAGFRSCYNRGLASNADIEGRIELRIQVGPAGEVQGVNATVNGNLPAGVVDCIKGRAKGARFQPPEGGAAAVSASYTFVKQ
jgi:hypothetical protein